ncbi:MAG: patatin-like phospholipase family protein [Spirochaetaceae bacterium]|nr:patatin-like phospholipase family protein [Spirochaetaceae bacterium]
MFKKLALILLLLLTLINPVAAQRPTVGLVLGGGGALGLAHIGVIKVLQEYNIPIDMIAGTSMGAIIGGLLALGYSADEMAYILREANLFALMNDHEKWRYTAPRAKLNPWNPMISNQGIVNSFSGLITGFVLNNFLDQLFWDAGHYNHFDELPIPFRATSYDPVLHRKVVFENGSLSRSIRASMAIPAVFTPVFFNGRPLFDGGIINNLPVQEAVDFGVDIIITIDLTQENDDDFFSVNLLSMLNITLQDRIHFDNMARSMSHIIINPKLAGFQIYSFNDAEILMALGEEAARQQLDQLLPLADPQLQRQSRNTREAVPIERIVIISDLDEQPYHQEITLESTRYVTREQARAMGHEYGFNLFAKSMHFHFSGTTLYYHIIPHVGFEAGAGIGFDSDFGARMQLGFSYRNINRFPLYLQNILTINDGLWNAGFLKFFPHNSLFFNFLFDWSLYDNLNGFFEYPAKQNGQVMGPNNYHFTVATAFVVDNSYYLTFGYRYHYMTTRDTPIEGVPASEHFNALRQEFIFNNLNHPRYPSFGLKVAIINEAGLFAENFFYRLETSAKIANPLTSFLSLHLGLKLGLVTGDNIPYVSYFNLGGLYDLDNHSAFLGYSRGEVTGRSLLRFNAALQHTMFLRMHNIIEWSGAFVDEQHIINLNYQNFYQSVGYRLAIDFNPYMIDVGIFWNIRRNQPTLTIKLGGFY